jgi:sporulation protein YlmC with PRC-barrel domain
MSYSEHLSARNDITTQKGELHQLVALKIAKHLMYTSDTITKIVIEYTKVIDLYKSIIISTEKNNETKM